jgi:pimeloyl-ACP methyl ester carboxylesterase
VLIHGFPEFWYSWRLQIPALAEAGYRVIAPDMRGYNLSDKPKGVSSYRVETLTNDVAGLIRHAGEERATVVGHDWGGAVAWYVPMHHPEVVDKLIVMNAPHPRAYQRELRHPRQLLKSWYVFFFQLPWLPEAAMRAGNYRAIDQVLRNDPVRRDAFGEDDVAAYKTAAAQPGAATATINYYRAAVRRNPFTTSRDLTDISAPTLLIWGERDRYLDVRLTQGLEQWVPNVRVERIAGASHWVQLDAPERVNDLMIDFLRSA